MLDVHLRRTALARLGALLALVLMLGSTAGCLFSPKREPLPPALTKALMNDGALAADPARKDVDVFSAFQRSVAREDGIKRVSHREPQNYLALSGGGIYGAFSVGVLTGWSESGLRPQFDVVTGISTGAIIATYAFLGPKYDGQLRECYAGEDAAKMVRPRRLSLLWAGSVGNVEPLKRAIEAAVTPEFLRDVAAAHAQGRRLYIGTTNLDTRRLVVWDMGAIASSGRPDTAQTYRDVILASSAVPGFFPPVMFDAEINGKRYQEMHVDGGTTCAVFFQPFMLNLDNNDVRSKAGSNLYVIEAGKTFDDPAAVSRGMGTVAINSLRNLMFAAKRNDLYRVYSLALMTGLNFRLASVPMELPQKVDSLKYDPTLVTRLHELGVAVGKNSQNWKTRPEDIGLEDDVRAPK